MTDLDRVYVRDEDEDDPGFRADLQETLDRTFGTPEYTREVEDYVPASGLWYGADVIAKASRHEGRVDDSDQPAPSRISPGGAGNSFEEAA